MKVGKLKKSIGDTSRIVRYMWYAFGGIVVLVVAAFAMIAWGWIGYMPPIEDMENPKDKFASEIYSSDMEVIGRFYQSKSNRVYVHMMKFLLIWSMLLSLRRTFVSRTIPA